MMLVADASCAASVVAVDVFIFIYAIILTVGLDEYWVTPCLFFADYFGEPGTVWHVGCLRACASRVDG